MTTKPKNRSYWRWHKRFAIFPVRIGNSYVWLRWYWWRVPFDISYPVRTVYRTINQPEFDYTDEIVAQEGAEQLLAEIKRRMIV